MEQGSTVPVDRQSASHTVTVERKTHNIERTQYHTPFLFLAFAVQT